MNVYPLTARRYNDDSIFVCSSSDFHLQYKVRNGISEMLGRTVRTFILGFLGCTLASGLSSRDILKSLLLVKISQLQVRVLFGYLNQIEFFWIVFDHGRASKSCAKIFCACT